MTAPANRPCDPWVPLEGCCEPPVDTPPELLAEVEESATDILWALLGRRFGICSHTVRPCRQRCRPAGYDAFPLTYSWGYEPWSLLVGCRCRPGNCGCTDLCQVTLPGPVAEITEVLVDGAVVPAEEYRVDEWRHLVRLGDECWPSCQDYSLDTDQPGTWSITYTRGRPVPTLARRAFSVLRCELVKLCNRDASCVLPRNMASVNRQGVTIQFKGDDATAALIEFIPEVALAVRRYNPRALQADAAIYRADALPSGRRTGT